MADEEQVLAPAEEVPEEPETPETPEEPETPKDQPEDLEQVRKNAKAFEDQRKRAEKAEAEAKRLREKYEPKKPKAQDDERESAAEQRAAQAEQRAARAELRSMGITHPDDIKLVMDAAKELNIDPLDAAEKKYVKAELEAQREVRESKEATPAPRRSGGAQRSSKEPDFKKMSDEEFDKWERSQTG